MGYALNISLTTYSAIQGKEEVKLYVHEALVTGGRDDSYTLYGFATKQERELYRLLITVSGVGANTARMIFVVYLTCRIVQRDSQWRRKNVEKREGNWLKNSPTHYC